MALLGDLLSLVGLSEDVLEHVELPEARGKLASSFWVDVAAQTSIAAAATGGLAIYRHRSGKTQKVEVTKQDAEFECTAYYRLDDETPDAWEKFSGLYPTSDGHVRVHANFDHHRDGVLELLELGNADDTQRDDVEIALSHWTSEDFETAANEMGLVVSKARTFEEWDVHPHAGATQDLPLIQITRLDDAPPRSLPAISTHDRPLTNVRVLDLTRILAGPVCGRTLAAYGADVMLVNAPHLPNIPVVIDTSRGKRSAHLDLSQQSDLMQFETLLEGTQVFVQGYRPGALANFGLTPPELSARHPGIVSVSLSAYGSEGPWGQRRGFDSLVQTATGFNCAEAEAFGADLPKPMPVQILDMATGFLMAFAAQAALIRQTTEGGSWHVELSLLKTADWLRQMGRRGPAEPQRIDFKGALQPYPCDEGLLLSMPHAARFSETPPTWERPAAMPGTHPPMW